jgi:hypothetical protein
MLSQPPNTTWINSGIFFILSVKSLIKTLHNNLWNRVKSIPAQEAIPPSPSEADRPMVGPNSSAGVDAIILKFFRCLFGHTEERVSQASPENSTPICSILILSSRTVVNGCSIKVLRRSNGRGVISSPSRTSRFAISPDGGKLLPGSQTNDFSRDIGTP